MSKQVMLLALAGMMLLALAVDAQTGDKKAEVLKRHQSKYGAPKHSNVSVLDACLGGHLAQRGLQEGGGVQREATPTAVR